MGGTWQQQNKSLPGAYINILGETPLSIKMSQRGIVALPVKLGWGEKGKVYKWDKIVDRGGNILIARSINLDGDIRKYRNVLKLKRKDLDKYFTELK